MKLKPRIFFIALISLCNSAFIGFEIQVKQEVGLIEEDIPQMRFDPFQDSRYLMGDEPGNYQEEKMNVNDTNWTIQNIQDENKNEIYDNFVRIEDETFDKNKVEGDYFENEADPIDKNEMDHLEI